MNTNAPAKPMSQSSAARSLSSCRSCGAARDGLSLVIAGLDPAIELPTTGMDARVIRAFTPVLDAPLDLLFGVGLAAPAVDLRPAGDPGLDAMAREVAVDRLIIEPIGGLG